MNAAAAALAAVIPWVAIIGFFGLLLKVRVSGDPALWKRIEKLEADVLLQCAQFKQDLHDERVQCDAKLAKLEGEIRQMQQRDQSFGRLSEGKPLAGQLHTAFREDRSDRDNDLIRKLDRTRGRKRTPRKPGGRNA